MDDSLKRCPPQGAIVEIIDGSTPADRPGFVFPDRVLINGTDVGTIAENGVQIDCGPGGFTSVTITLVPSRVEIKAVRDYTVVDGRILKGE